MPSSRHPHLPLLLAAALAPGLLASGKPGDGTGSGDGATRERKVPAGRGAQPAPVATLSKRLGIPMTVGQIQALMGMAIREDPRSYGADQRLAFGACGRDLRNWNLRGQDLRDLDLRRRRLEGADLTGARLDRSNLTGVSLKGARLFGATTFFTRGLDLTGAQVHPFFSDLEEAPFGDLRWLHLGESEEDPGGQPRCLASTPDFPLVYVTGDGRRQRVVGVTGITYDITLDSKARIQAVTADARGRLVTLAEDALLIVSVKEGGAGHLDLDQKSSFLPVPLEEAGGLLDFRAGPTVAVDLAFDKCLLRLQSSKRALWSRMTVPADLAIAHGLHTREGKQRVLAIKDENRLVIQGGTSRVVHTLPAGTSVGGLALGHDGRVWLTYTGKGGHGLGRLDPVTHRLETIPVPDLKAGARPRELGALVARPDGLGVCYCDGGGRIGCMLDVGAKPAFVEVILEEGDRPVTLTPSWDGRVLFTLAGQSRIGAIQARIPVRAAGAQGAGPVAGGAGSGAAEAGQEDKRPRMADGERRERAYQLEARHRERLLSGLEEPHGEEAADPAAPEGKPGTGEPALVEGAGQPGPAPATARDRLLAGGVVLGRERLAAIQAKHGYDRRPDKSQFAEAYSSPEALEELLAEGLDGAEIGRIRSTTVEGSYLTFCSKAGVGFCHDGAAWVPTDRFVVVTVPTMDRSRQIVKTAFPVR